MTAIDVEVQVGTAPLVDVDVQLEPPTFTVISVLPTGPRGPAGPQGDTGATGADGAPGADGQDGADGAPGQDGADGAPGLVQSIVPGVNITVDDTDPANPIVSSTSGSGLPEQWSDGGNGNVTATVDDPAKTALTVEAVTGQTAPLVDLKDEDSGTAFAIVSHVPAVDDVWTINGIAGAPIVADAGDYTIGSLFMDPTYPNTGQAPAVVVSVGDDAATIEAAFDAAIGAGLVTVTGDWSDLTLHFVPPDGVVYGHFLYIAANALTQGAVPVVDPTTINTTVGHTANIEEAGPYGRAFGKVTPSGINGQPTLFDPDAKSWQERGYVGWLWTETIVQDTMGFGKPNKLTLHRFAQRGMTTRPENIGDNTEVHTGVFEIQALSDDDAAYVQEYIQIEIAPDGSHRRGYFEFHNDLNDGTVGQVAQDPVVSIETNDDYTQQRLKALPGQTEPLFIFRDENAADVGRVMPDGLVISNARTLPDVADLAIGDHGSVCDPIAQTVTLFMKNDAGNLCLAEIPMTEIP